MKNRSLFACALVAAAGTVAIAQDRSYDGSGNNIANPTWGMAGTDQVRGPSGAHYTDGLGGMIDRGNPRAITNLVSAQTPAGLGNSRNLSSWTWQWGQFLDHDLALVDDFTNDHADIAIPTGDPTFDPMGTGTAVMPLTRAVHTGGVNSPRQQQDLLTNYLDGSMVYGSDAFRANALRSHAGGRLATSAGNFLPYNTAGLINAEPTGGTNTDPNFFVAGDIRSNEQTGLTTIHTIFMREHNRVADQIAAANPSWNDEQIYQKARHIVGGEIQAITYNEWLPALLGGANAPGSYSGYNPNVNATMNATFSGAAFRLGHTMLNDVLPRYNADGTHYAGGDLTLFQQFFNPFAIQQAGSLDAIVRGLARQQANEIDAKVIDGVRNLLFGGTNGRDLIAVNIQRGRDDGLPDYNTVRQDYGLVPVTGFDQISSDPAVQAALQAAYGNVNNIDVFIGLFAEDHLPGGSMGATETAILVDQFTKLRDGDRFFYLNDSTLTADEQAYLSGLRLSDIFRWNTGATDVQDNIFFAVPAPGSVLALGAFGLLATRRRRA
ncbi:MAG: peroxidase family protein [Phycisphaerales bacterium]|jgi:hypothetical protein